MCTQSVKMVLRTKQVASQILRKPLWPAPCYKNEPNQSAPKMCGSLVPVSQADCCIKTPHTWKGLALLHPWNPDGRKLSGKITVKLVTMLKGTSDSIFLWKIQPSDSCSKFCQQVDATLHHSHMCCFKNCIFLVRISNDHLWNSVSNFWKWHWLHKIVFYSLWDISWSVEFNISLNKRNKSPYCTEDKYSECVEHKAQTCCVFFVGLILVLEL